MAPSKPLSTPPASGTVTPTTSSLTADKIRHDATHTSQVAPLDASRLITSWTTSPKQVPAMDDPSIPDSNTFTDHMVSAVWKSKSGWAAPELKPYGPLSIMPSASVLHYATECFEGLKLYRGHDGRLRLFRVRRNCDRMRRSCARISLPDFDPAALDALITRLCAVDGPKWLPKSRPGKFLYIRPTMIATHAGLGVQVPQEALLFVIICVFPDLSDPSVLDAAPNGAPADDEDQVHGLKLLASKEDTIRAWPGGFGYAKLGANYGPSLVAQGEARSRGFNQILWLYGPDGNVTEAGASNFFVVWRTKAGKLQLVTAPLEEKIILEGVTRASVLQIAAERLSAGTEGAESLEVLERKFTMQELADAVLEGRLVEAFASGTAFFIAPVGLIEWKGQSLRIPLAEGRTGVYARLIRSWLSGIIYGEEQHEWGVVVDEEGSA